MNNDDDKSKAPQETEDVTHTDVTGDTQSTEQHSTEEHSTEKKQDDSASDDNTEKTWHNKNALKRGIAMLGYGFVAGFVRLGITLIAIFQFFSLLFAEKANQPLVKFGQNLNTYLYQINQFLTINSEMYPFPFADWPDSAPKE